jgi:hypothetical protein
MHLLPTKKSTKTHNSGRNAFDSYRLTNRVCNFHEDSKFAVLNAFEGIHFSRYLKRVASYTVNCHLASVGLYTKINIDDVLLYKDLEKG